MSTCSKKLKGNAKVRYNALALEIGDQKTNAIYQLYDGFNRDEIIEDNPSANSFFKNTLYNEESKLFKDSDSPIDVFEVAFSDDFRKEHPWIEAQKKYEDALSKNTKDGKSRTKKQKRIIFENVADKLKINPDNYYEETFEPKIDIVEAERERISITNIIQDTIEFAPNKADVINHINTARFKAYKDIYNIDTIIIDKEDLPAEKKNAKAWYNKKEKRMYVVKSKDTLDTPIHEMFHPILEVFRKDIDSDIYVSLIKDLKKYENESWYKAVIEKYGKTSTVQQLNDELIVTAVGLNADGKLNKIKASNEGKSFLKKLTDAFLKFLENINIKVSEKYNVTDNLIDLKGVSDMTIDNMADIMLSEYAIKGMKEAIFNDNLFYDKEGKPIRISNEEGLLKFIDMHSKELGNDKSTVTAKTKMSEQELYEKSNDNNLHNINKNTSLVYPTLFDKESLNENDRFNNVNNIAYALTTRFFAEQGINSVEMKKNHDVYTDRYKEKYDIVVSMFVDVKNNLKLIANGDNLRIETEGLSGIQMDAYDINKKLEVKSNFSREVGLAMHDVQDKFFKRLQELKDNDTEINTESLLDLETTLIENDISSITEINGKKEDFTDIYIKEIESLIDFVKETEKRYAGRKIVYRSEYHIKNDELNMAAKADLVVIIDDSEFEVYDTKTRRQDFKHVWFNAFKRYERPGLSNIVTSGLNKTSLQASYAALIIEKNTGMKFLANKALFFKLDVETKKEDGEGGGYYDELKGIEFIKDDDSHNYLSLLDYRSEIINSFDKEKQDLFIDKSGYEKGSINTVPDMMAHILDGRNLDSINYTKSAENKLNHLDANPNDPNDMGFFTGEVSTDFIGMLAAKEKVFVSLTGKTEIEKMSLLEAFYKKKNEGHNSYMNDIIAWNNTGNKPGSANNAQTAQMTAILNTIPEGFVLKRLSDVKGMEEFNEIPILLAENIITGVSSLIYLSKTEDGSYTFKSENEGKDRTTILGADYADKIAKVKFKNKKLREATKSNFRKIYIGMAAIKMKEVNPNFKMERMYITKGVYTDAMPEPMDMRTIMDTLKTVKDNFKGKTSARMNTFFDNTYNFNSTVYNIDNTEVFKSVMSDSQLLSSTSIENGINLMNDFQAKKSGTIDTLRKLRELESEMRKSILNKKNTRVEDEPEYIALMKAIKQIYGISDVIINDSQGLIQKWTALEHNATDYTRQALKSVTSLFDVAIRRDFDTYEKAKNNVLTDMFKSKNLSFNKKILTQSMLEGFDNLFQNKNNYNDPNTLMKLKNPDDKTDTSLNDKEREFIRFFNEQVFENLKKTAPSIFDGMESIEEMKEHTKGWVPIFKATTQTKQARMKINPLKNVDFDLNDSRTQTKNNDPLSINNDFEGMFKQHKYKAGWVEEDSKERTDYDFDSAVETNLEYILNRFVVKGIETEMHNFTLMAHHSMDTLMKGQAFMFGDQALVNEMIKELNDSASMFIRNESRRPDALSKLGEKMGYAASMSVIAFSTKQAVMDSLTFTFASSATAMSNLIYKAFGGDTKKLGYFDVSSWAKAGRLVMKQTPLIKQIIKEFALDTNDSMVLSGDSRLKTMRKGMMEMGFFVTKEMGILAQTQLMIASMIYDGSFNAYSLNNESGKLAYDEKKDLRLYNEDGTVKDESFLYAVKEQAFKEGYGLEEYNKEKGNEDLKDRKLLRGYTNKERNTIVYKAIDMIGALSKDTRIKAEQITIFKHFLKFKTWLAAKKDLYVKEGAFSDSFNEWDRIVDADGNVTYSLNPQWTEGVIPSLVSISNKLKAYGIKEALGEITDVEKRNMAILASHLSFFTLLMAMGYGLRMTCDDNADFCWLDDTQVGKTTEKLITNVSQDMIIALPLWNIVAGDNSLFASISILQGIAGRLIDLAVNVPFEDDDVSWRETLHKYMKQSWSTYRSGVEFYEIMDGFDSAKSNKAEKKIKSKAKGRAKIKENRIANKGGDIPYSETNYTKGFPMGPDRSYNVDWEGFK